MPNYRRAYIPGGTYFFTVVTYHRRPIFKHQAAQQCLREAIRECRSESPFDIVAMVLLPDHLHTIWTLPHDDDDYSSRWSRIKRRFTQRWLASGGRDIAVSIGSQIENRRGIWQRRFWEHVIQDEEDSDAHFDYVHYNPVKHGYVSSPKDWRPSSFHSWVEKNVYSLDWGAQSIPTTINVAGEIGEPL